MRPTDEQIEKMEARGWKPNGGAAFIAGVAPARLNVWAGRQGWYWGCEWVLYDVEQARDQSPEQAAAAAESWLRGVLGEFRFPWLRVEG